MTSEFKFTIYYTKKKDLIECLYDIIQQVKEDYEDGGVQLSEGRAVAYFKTDQTDQPIEKVIERIDEEDIDETDDEELEE